MIEAAKKEYKEAYEAGDPDKIVQAQEKLNQAQAEQLRIQDYKPKKERKKKKFQQTSQHIHQLQNMSQQKKTRRGWLKMIGFKKKAKKQ